MSQPSADPHVPQSVGNTGALSFGEPHLKIGVANCDFVVIRSRAHFWCGFVEDGLSKAVVVIDAPGVGPADLSTIPCKNAPVKDLDALRKKN